MGERTFLENVGKPCSINAIGSARAWEVHHLRNDPTLPPLIYIIESDVGEQFLLGRGVSGRLKFNMIRYIAKAFVELFFEKLSGKGLSQYIILRGAYPFELQYAFGYAPPYDRKALSGPWAGEPSNVEYRIQLEDGRTRWITSRGRRTLQSPGGPPRLTGVSLDITERKLAEKEMHRMRLQLWHADRVAQTGVITGSLSTRT